MGRRLRALRRLLAGLTTAAAPALALAATAGPALGAGAPVENFGLLDHEGRFHELYRESHRSAVVLFVQGNGCPISRKNVPALKTARTKFGERGVTFWMLNANPQDALDEIAAEAEGWGIDFPILKDDAQLVARALDLERTAEALVIDPRSWTIVYRGPLDDRLGYETERPVRERYLEDALARHLAGERVETSVREPRGCLIQFERPDGGDGNTGHGHGRDGEHGAARGSAGPAPSYAHDVAPILAERCRTCHQDGGVAPWAMTDWATVRGWAPMMREVLRTGRMPPWRIDPRYGHFRNDLSLPSHERATLVRWVEAGAPRGDGEDPLRARPAAAPLEWPLGEPDRVIEIAEQRIPATGVVDYRYQHVDLELETERWVVAADVQPSNPAVMHHTVVWIRPPKGEPRGEVEGPRFTRGQFASYVPGRTPGRFPEGTGFRVPAGSRLRFQIHYTTTGRPEVDTPRLALYFADAPVEHELHVGAVADFDFMIPPRADDHRVGADLELSRDVLVYSLSPHMHYRGTAIRYDLHTPDGRSETLLSVPRYDFNWQHRYDLAAPIAVPAGSRLEVTARFDNSSRNPANPEPDVWVGWGEQSFEEMMFGYFLYRERGANESAERWHPAPAQGGSQRQAAQEPSG